MFGVGHVGRQVIAGRRVVPGATLDLSFMAPGTLDPNITFTRTSTATYFDVTGTIQTAAANTPRWDYNPSTHALNGLLIEEARTNLLLNSATLSTQSVTTTAVATTLSFYGTGTVTLSGTSTAGPLTGTGAGNRVSLTFTPTAGTLTCTVTGSVTNAQLEAGGFASSFIPTAGTTATRAIDSATVATAAWFSNALAFSYAVEAIDSAISPVAVNVITLDDGTNNNRTQLGIGLNTANLVFFQNLAGAVTANIPDGTLTLGAPYKAAASTTSGAHQAAFNGAVSSLGTSANTPPTGITTMRLCRPVTATTGVQWIRRARFWPRALSASELQSVTR
jgi:hypothetical protein